VNWARLLSISFAGGAGISIVDTQPDIQIPSFKDFFKEADKFLGNGSGQVLDKIYGQIRR
jgi:hypothetical protein